MSRSYAAGLVWSGLGQLGEANRANVASSREIRDLRPKITRDASGMQGWRMV